MQSPPPHGLGKPTATATRQENRKEAFIPHAKILTMLVLVVLTTFLGWTPIQKFSELYELDTNRVLFAFAADLIDSYETVASDAELTTERTSDKRIKVTAKNITLNSWEGIMSHKKRDHRVI